MFVGLAIYFIAKSLQGVFMPIYLIIQNPSLKTIGTSFLMLLTTIFYILVLIYFLIIKRNKWSKKIVDVSGLQDTEGRMQWIPMVFRLMSVTMGIYLLLLLLLSLNSVLLATMSMNGHQFSANMPQILRRYLGQLIFLPIAVYLLCGAPHFVRWQVKKTIELCKEQDAK